MSTAKHKSHLMHYLFLVVVMGFMLTFFITNAGYPNNQFLIVVAASIFYFLWGVVHHSADGDLHPKIVIEYLLVSVLSILIIRGALIK